MIAKQTVPRPPNMEKFELYAQGYRLPLVTDASGDAVDNEMAYRVFGQDGELSYIELAGGTFNLTAINSEEMKVLGDLLSDQNPELNDDQSVYYPSADVCLDITRNLKSKNNHYYERAEFWGNWHTALQPVQGAPGGFGTFTQGGRCDAPIVFQSNKKNQGVAVLTDVVDLAKTEPTPGYPVLQGFFNFYAPLMIPVSAKGSKVTGKYALSLELQRRDAEGNIRDPESDCKRLLITNKMVKPAILNRPAAPAPATAGVAAIATDPENWGEATPPSEGDTWKYAVAVKYANGINSEALYIPPITLVEGENAYLLTISPVENAVGYVIYRSRGGEPEENYTWIGELGPIEAPTVVEDFYDVDVDQGNGHYQEYLEDVEERPLRGRVTITPEDLKGTGWTVNDLNVSFKAFVHYLYSYIYTGPEPLLIGDGLYTLGRWQRYTPEE
jgi:hypothetical protein